MTKSEAKRRLKLDRILTESSRLFATAEFHLVSMDHIAQSAGVGKGTLYNLFRSKEDLYFSIIRMRLSELIAILERTYGEREEPLKNIRSLIIHLHKFMEKYHYFYIIWKREESMLNGRADHREIRELEERINRLILRLLHSGESNGVIKAGLDHRLVARLFIGMVDALRKDPLQTFNLEPQMDTVLDILMSGIGVEGIDTKVRYEERRHRRPAEGSRHE